VSCSYQMESIACYEANTIITDTQPPRQQQQSAFVKIDFMTRFTVTTEAFEVKMDVRMLDSRL
jgi:hypothetical protein